MIEMIEQVKPTVNKLLQDEEDQLFEELGIRYKAIERDLTKSGSFEPEVVYDGTLMGPLDDLRDLGERIFKRLECEIYNLLCGSNNADEKDRKELSKTLKIGHTEAAAFISVMLVTHLAMAPAFAAVVAALVVKRIFIPAGDEFCKYWSEKLTK